MKLCPFCGSTKVRVLRSIDSPFTDGYFGKCSTCQCEGPPARTKEEAVAMWDNRIGSISDVEATTGKVKYTENFTPPTEPYIIKDNEDFQFGEGLGDFYFDGKECTPPEEKDWVHIKLIREVPNEHMA